MRRAIRRVVRWELWWPGEVHGLTWRQRRHIAGVAKRAARAGARIALEHRMLRPDDDWEATP